MNPHDFLLTAKALGAYLALIALVTPPIAGVNALLHRWFD